MSRILDDPHLVNQLASDWMHRGIDLLKEDSAAALEHAVKCFDEAIALRRTLPLGGNPFLRYGLSAGWINRGDALARRGESWALAEAIRSYDKALLLLETLRLEENGLYPRRLAITWINRGIALQKQQAPGDLWEAAECFREAIQVLEHSPEAAISDGLSLQAGAWVNLAGVMACSDGVIIEDARLAARRALALAVASEQTDRVMAEAALKARHVLCRLVVKEFAEEKPVSSQLMAEATDAVDEALLLARRWQRAGDVGFTGMAREVFCFGCRIYEVGQPHFLAEFLLECLDPGESGEGLALDQASYAAAQAAIWGALNNLQADGFSYVATPDFSSFLADIQELKKAEERLEQLRLDDCAGKRPAAVRAHN